MGVVFCDLDDVIADTETVIVEYARKFTREILKRVTEDGYDGLSTDYFYFVEKFKWTEDELRLFFTTYYPGYLREISCTEGSKEYITKIIERGHEFNIISARYPNEKIDVHQLTTEWLTSNGIPFSNLFIGQQKKDLLINQYNEVIAFIDDSVQNCIDIREKTNCEHVILLEKQYNCGYSPQNHVKVKSWKEIYEIICEHS